MFFSRFSTRGRFFQDGVAKLLVLYVQLTHLKKPVNFLDSFDITPRFHILLAKYTIINNDQERGLTKILLALLKSSCLPSLKALVSDIEKGLVDILP